MCFCSRNERSLDEKREFRILEGLEGEWEEEHATHICVGNKHIKHVLLTGPHTKN
jgi:hypothetical protein